MLLKNTKSAKQIWRKKTFCLRSMHGTVSRPKNASEEITIDSSTRWEQISIALRILVIVKLISDLICTKSKAIITRKYFLIIAGVWKAWLSSLIMQCITQICQTLWNVNEDVAESISEHLYRCLWTQNWFWKSIIEFDLEGRDETHVTFIDLDMLNSSYSSLLKLDA